jgi:predicted RNA methylase
MNIWSDVEYVYRCLADFERTRAFGDAIARTVKHGQIVLDLGTGSGIMALFAARAGARRVYAIEVGEYLFRAANQIIADNGYASLITTLRMDARDVTLQCVEKPDVVLCEMVTTGLIGEMQAPVINALKRTGVIDEHTTLIPSALSISASLVHADYAFFGFEVRFPIFVDYFSHAFERPIERLSVDAQICSVSFTSGFDEKVSVQRELRAAKAGAVNGLMLQTRTRLAPEVSLEKCISYCQPVIIPVRQLDVAEGDVVSLSLSYTMGKGFDDLVCALDLAR